MADPKTFKRRMTIFWWAHQWIHIRFIAREMTSVCVAGYVIILLFYVRATLDGPEAFQEFSGFLQSPFMIVLHVIALGGLLFHSITWFNLAPKALVLKVADRQVPGAIVALLNYGGWVAISLGLAWLFLNG